MLTYIVYSRFTWKFQQQFSGENEKKKSFLISRLLIISAGMQSVKSAGHSDLGDSVYS